MLVDRNERACDAIGCKNCGFNPKVHEKRLRELERYCREGRLREWGKQKSEIDGRQERDKK